MDGLQNLERFQEHSPAYHTELRSHVCQVPGDSAPAVGQRGVCFDAWRVRRRFHAKQRDAGVQQQLAADDAGIWQQPAAIDGHT